MKLKHLKKSLTLLAGIITILTANVAPVARVAAWGPADRPTYTNEKPADYATFNSITNNAAVGDERNFVRIKEIGTSDSFSDEVQVTPGHEYEVWIYYHNNAATDTNETGLGMATNTRVASAYPTVVNTGERGMISGIITWSYVTPSDPSNAKEGKIWDEAYVTSATDGVVLRYKTGTAKIINGGKANGSILPETLFTKEGTPIGYNKLTGNLPGCAEYSGQVVYTLVAEQTDSTLDKQISLDGENWSDSVEAKPGDFVTYKVVFKNTGNTNFTNVIFKDTHDEDLLLRSNSIKVYDVDNPDGKTIEDILDISGYNVGDVRAGALVQITYQMQVREDMEDCEKTLKNTISVAYNSKENQKEDTTTVIVTKEDCNPTTPPETPTEIVKTGPLEITMAAIVILGIGAGGFYLYRTRRTLKTVESAVTGPEGGINPSTDSSAPIDSITPTESSAPEAPETPSEEPAASEAPASFSAPAEPTPEQSAPETSSEEPQNPVEPTPEQ